MACVYRPCYFAVLKMINLRVSYFGVSVYPSMNPSRVQLRRSSSMTRLSPTPKYSLSIGVVGTIAVLGSYRQWNICFKRTVKALRASGPRSQFLNNITNPQGTACVYRPCYFAVLKMINLCMSYFGVSVYPSMNPSRVQLRRSSSMTRLSHLPRSTR